MAQYNGNGIYLDIDGTQVDARFIEFTFETAMESVETTAGSSTVHRARAEGLKDTSATLRLGYDTTTIATDLPLIEVGTHTYTYGPEGTNTGKPKHVQSFICTGVSHGLTVDKQHVILEASLEAAAAPTTDMYAGGVW